MKKIISILLAALLLIGSTSVVIADEKKTPIIGEPTTTIEQMETWAKAKKADPDFVKEAKTFYNVSVKYGIDPAVTYAQSAKETNFFKFTGVVSKDHFNPCGLKITAGGSDTDKQAHKKFKNWEEGITAQVHHLALYAGHSDFPYDADKTPDPRHFPSIYGKAPHVEDLGARWAPSKTYGWETAIMMYDLTTTLVNGKDPIPGPAEKPVIPKELLKPVDPKPVDPKPVDPKPELPIPSRTMQRLFGINRISTSIKVSNELNDKADEIILASAQNYADALVASSLTNKNGKYIPILLNSGDRLNSEVKAEISRLGAKRVTVIGGTSLIPNSVINDITSINDVSVERIAGKNRFETANKITDRLGTQKNYVLTNGNVFADALSVSSYSALKRVPVLLTDGKTLDAQTEAKLNAADNVVIIGGVNSVSGPIGDKLRQNGVTVSRISGSNRFATSVEVAKKLFPQNKVFVVADGLNFPDSLVGAPLAAKYGGTLLLTNSNGLPDVISGYLNSAKPTHMIVLGGNNSVSASVYNALDMKIK